MPAIFEVLPGIEVPVGEISKSLAAMWTDSSATGAPVIEADDAKATQVNLVLHFGLNTTESDATKQFQTVVEFSKRCPGRIVVLCPLHQDDGSATAMRAKIYAECYLGKSKSDKRCVEFVMLGYPRAARDFLESQVSICLSADLPLYYWAHRFANIARLADYRFLLGRAKRVLIDSAVAPADAFTFPWPNPRALRDLVYSRLLPVRQTIGQFLASYPAATLAGGLRAVTVSHAAALTAEGRVILAWFSRRLADCGMGDGSVSFELQPLANGAAGSLAVRFDYADAARFFRWSGDLATGHALFEADLGNGRATIVAAVSLLTPENALSEAMFS